MENTLIYYRPSHTNTEVLTEKQMSKLIKVWGKNPYNHFDRLEIDHNYGTAFHMITEVMAFIQCDRVLNEKFQELQELIKSKPEQPHKNYYTKTQKKALKLFSEGVIGFNKEVDEEDKVREWKIPNNEIFRVFGIPYWSIMNDVDNSIEKVGKIPKPKKTYKIKYDLCKSDQCSTYKLYYVKGRLNERGKFVNINFDDVNVGKIYQSYDKDYIQIYLHDYARSNRGLQVVVDRLVKRGILKLS